MGFMDKVSDFINKEAGDEAEQMQDPMQEEDYSQDFGAQVNNEETFSYSQPINNNMDNVMNFSTSCTPVVLKKVTNYAETQEVADALNEKRIVILNLESCKRDDAIRVIDFLSGVAYANGGGLKPIIARKAYIITPNRVPLTGDFGDDFDAADMDSNSFVY